MNFVDADLNKLAAMAGNAQDDAVVKAGVEIIAQEVARAYETS